VKPGGEASTDAATQGRSSSAAAASKDRTASGESDVSKDRTASGEAASSKGKNGDAKKAGAGMVKVIVGTRRYHGTACPLIRGAGESGVESMTLARAEAAGLTSCSVCQNDRETVG
jgi:NAD(P)H-hydrate repair Nnr-like enzyme with NAD(P)H-hydrate dehydratase domain